MNKIVISILIWLVCMPCMVADEMRDYAKKHDSKYGFVIALYTQAFSLWS